MAEDLIATRVTTHADFLFPAGSTQLGDNVVVLPNGEKLKFWVSVEQICDADGEETYADLDTVQLEQRSVYVEYNKSAELEGDLPAAPQPEGQ